jgi:DMSO/TMAO reductase YedYZ molybdopterin-dependent catalytic subunit
VRPIALFVAFLLVSAPTFSQMHPPSKAANGPSELKIGGAVATPFSVSLDDLKKMPRKTLRVENPHTKKAEVYEGVPLEALLQKAGVPQGEQLRGAGLVSYALVDAADDYHVLFSLAELDTSFQDSEVLLADTMDAAPLAAGEGPFKLVAPHEKRPGRWVKMVGAITVGQAAK